MRRTIMCIRPKRLACLLFVMTLFAGILSINGLCLAYDKIYTITGKIQDIQGQVIILEPGKKLRPFHEVDIPDWAVAGTRATLSYVVRSRVRYYLEIVRPGEKLNAKEEIKRARKTRY